MNISCRHCHQVDRTFDFQNFSNSSLLSVIFSCCQALAIISAPVFLHFQKCYVNENTRHRIFCVYLYSLSIVLILLKFIFHSFLLMGDILLKTTVILVCSPVDEHLNCVLCFIVMDKIIFCL